MVPPRRALAGIAALAGSTGLAATDWPTYHQNAQRTGNVTGLQRAGSLSQAWSTSLRGEVADQPLIIGGTVVAATEEDTVYALSRATGKILWRTTVGHPLPLAEQPCGNLNPLGITGTPVYDPARRRPHLRPVRRPLRHCGPYIGSVVGAPAPGQGPIWSYRVPTPKQGGIWAAAGPVVAASGTIYVSSGNGGRFGPPYDGSDSVIVLSPQLRRTGVFAPANWAYLSSNDLDLGSMSPALTSDGRILQVGKSRVAYLLNASHHGGVGGELAQAPVCVAASKPAFSTTRPSPGPSTPATKSRLSLDNASSWDV